VQMCITHFDFIMASRFEFTLPGFTLFLFCFIVLLHYVLSFSLLSTCIILLFLFLVRLFYCVKRLWSYRNELHNITQSIANNKKQKILHPTILIQIQTVFLSSLHHPSLLLLLLLLLLPPIPLLVLLGSGGHTAENDCFINSCKSSYLFTYHLCQSSYRY